MSIPKSLTFIDRFTIKFTNSGFANNVTAKITSYSSTGVSYTKKGNILLLSILFYVAYKLDIPVDIAYKRELFSTIINSYYPDQFQSYNIGIFTTLLKSINEKYNADPVVKSMMTSWTQMGPFSATLTQKLTTKAMDLKRKYVNKQGYIKPAPGVTYTYMPAPYLLYNSFFNMYEITYSLYTQNIGTERRANMANGQKTKLYRFELFDKSGIKVTGGLEVLVDVLSVLASGASSNASPSWLSELKHTCSALIENIKYIVPDRIITIRDYKDSTFLKIKTGLDLLDKLYKSNPGAREYIDNCSKFTPIQFIQL